MTAVLIVNDGFALVSCEGLILLLNIEHGLGNSDRARPIIPSPHSGDIISTVCVFMFMQEVKYKYNVHIESGRVDILIIRKV
jgi:hypothetical protein